MTDTTFVYTIHIHATPEQVWAGLTDPAITCRYWGTELESDWQIGSQLIWHESGTTIADPEQIVLEVDAPRRLSYTWHTFTAQWGTTYGFDEDLVRSLASEPRSAVVFDIEDIDDVAKLTVSHRFGAGRLLHQMCSRAWPQLLSDLKTLLEAAPVDRSA